MFSKLRRNIKGAITASVVITIAIGFLLVAILVPIAMEYIANASVTNTTAWGNPTVATIFTVLLPILFVIGIAVRYIPRK